jgi:Tol biopolymer transport system component
MGFRSEIVIADANGKNMEVLTEGLYPSWSPDGSMIAFTPGNLNTEIHTIKIDDGLRKSLGIIGVYPLFSPDGKKIAYVELFLMPGIEMWLCIVDVDGENQKRLIGLSSIAGIPHSWAPDSRHIAYCDDGELYTISVETLEYKKIVCPRDDGELERLINVDWSPKGDKLALVSEKILPNPLVNIPLNSDKGIWIVNADGSNAKRLTRDAEVAPEWSPDGTEIAFVDGARIFIMESDGENVRRLTDNNNMGLFEFDPSWFGIPAVMQLQNSLMATWGRIKTSSNH